MSATINFSSHFTYQISCTKSIIRGKHLHSSPLRKSCPVVQNNMKAEQHGISATRHARNDLTYKHKCSFNVSSLSDDSCFRLNPYSASDTIYQFYMLINEKNVKELQDYIADDCVYEECSFPDPMLGKKEVMNFFEQLTSSMGNNVKFSIENLCEDNEYAVAVSWHLEWRNKSIPFTRGCSFYECTIEGERLAIRRARVVIESPIKPGGIVLTLLKNVTSLFDEFPKATEWFLRSPQVILQFFIRIYNIFFAPFINPLLSTYVKIGNLIARFIGFIFSMLLYIVQTLTSLLKGSIMLLMVTRRLLRVCQRFAVNLKVL